MKQKSFATTGFELITKRTHKREFLDEMNLVVPWAELVGLIEPHAPFWQDGTSAVCINYHAAHPLHAAMVWPV